MIIICITNHKGGVGKSTTAINVAYALSMKKSRAGKPYKVLVIDFDPQGNTSGVLGRISQYEQPRTVEDLFLKPDSSILSIVSETKYKNIDLIANNLDAAANTVSLDTNDPTRLIGLKIKLEEDPRLNDYYDFVLIDCPPHIDSMFFNNGIIVSDYYIIPVAAESSFALSGVNGLMKAIDKVKSRINKKLSLLGILLTMYDSRTVVSKRILESVTGIFGANNIFTTKIHTNTAISKANISGRAICDYDGTATGCRHYRALADEIIAKIQSFENK